MDKCKSQLGIILSAIDDYFLEIQNSILSIIVGVWFFIYPYDFNAYPGSFQFLDIIPTYIMGTIYTLFGILHLLCLMSRYGFRRIRRQIMLIKSALWAFLAINILLANPYSLTGYFAIVFMIMTFSTFLKVQILPSDLDIHESVRKLKNVQ